ncbi:MAG: hypothetical protein ACYDBB_24890 [Armatimonadota bacterium]
MTETRKSMSRGERRLITATGIFVVIVLLFAWWWVDANTNPVVSIPAKKLPNPNAYDFYMQAGGALVQSITLKNGENVDRGRILDAINQGIPLSLTMSHTPSPPAGTPLMIMDQPTLADYDALMKANAPVITALHKGFACEYADPSQRSMNTLFPVNAKAREMARLLIEKAYIDKLHGNWNGAMDDYLDALQLGATFPRQATMIGMLVGVAVEGIGRADSWGVVNHLTAPQARADAKRMEGIMNQQVSFADVLTEEKYFIQAGLLELMRQPNWRKTLAGYAGTASGGSADKVLIAQMYLHSKREVMHNTTAYHDALIAQAKQPYITRQPLPPLPSDPASRIMAPVFAKARIKMEVNRAQDALLTVTLALRAYYIEHGSYPAMLQQLTPGYLSKLPDDPFALNGPLQYRRSGKTYVLYSIGPDGKNNGGTPSKDGVKGIKANKPTLETSTGDMVAGVNTH